MPNARPLGLWLLIAVWSVGVFAIIGLLPPFEGNDEEFHFHYAVYVAHTGALPSRVNVQSSTMLQQSGQAPLAYLVTAGLWRVLGILPPADSKAIIDPHRNPWFTPPDWSAHHDNYNMHLHAGVRRPKSMVQGLIVARLTCWAWGILGLVALYGAAYWWWGHRTRALVAAAIFAFTPQYLYMGGRYSNDMAMTALCAVATYLLIRLWKTPPPQRHARLYGLMGAALGAAVCAKVNALLVFPIFVGASVWLSRRVSRTAWLVGAFLVLTLPWFTFGASQGDVFGLATHDPEGRVEVPGTPAQIVTALPDVFASYFSKLGTSSAWLPTVVYVGWILVVVAALVGIGRSTLRVWRTGPHRDLFPVAVLALMVVATGGGFLYWLRTKYEVAYAISGRLAYMGIRRWRSCWRLACWNYWDGTGFTNCSWLVCWGYSRFPAPL